MLNKLSPVEHNVGKVVPNDEVLVVFRTKEDLGYKIRKSAFERKEVKYKAVQINVDMHINYYSDDGGSRREKTMSVGMQSIFTSHDGSIRNHKVLFVVPNFDVYTFSRASIYFSSGSLSPVNVSDVDISIRKEVELEVEHKNSLVFVSTWGIRCGIATYSGFLIDAINRVGEFGKDIVENDKDIVGNGKLFDDIIVVDVNEGINVETIYAKLCQIEHEFGILPSPPRVSKKTKCLVTFHTIMTDITEDGLGIGDLIEMGMGGAVGKAIGGNDGVGSGREMGMKFTMDRYENALNIAGYIVHNQDSANVLNRWTNKDVHVVPHGSYYVPKMDMMDARKMLELDKLGVDIKNDKIGFIFGFQSPNKNYAEVIEVAKRIGMKLIISGARHGRGVYNWNKVGVGNGIMFLDKFLTELEVNLFALSSDVLLFNYPMQDHYSVSGALHRLIGAGRPCILSKTRHFLDVKEYDDGVLKFIPGDKDDMQRKILEGLENRVELGIKAGEYAERTSWDNVAREHLNIYSKYINNSGELNE